MVVGVCAVGVAVIGIAAHAGVPRWMESIISGSKIEAALFRVMDIPEAQVTYPRPPAEARTKLDSLIAGEPKDAELYALRAHVDEQALDFASAEKDWQAVVAHTEQGSKKVSAQLELADFYHRRNEGPQEIAALEITATAPAPPDESLVPANQQTAWRAYNRALVVARQQGLGDDATVAIYRAWIARYPNEPAVRAEFLKTLLSMRRFDDASKVISDYQTAFPKDESFPIRAEALIAVDEGSPRAVQDALTEFEQAFQPVWDPALVRSYMELLSATHTQHASIARARAQLEQNPDDLRSAAFLFDAFAQQGRSDIAGDTLASYAASKQQRHAMWTPDELNTFATLLERAHQPTDAARFYYALASSHGSLTGNPRTPEEAGLCGLIRLLLEDGDTPIAIGSGNLSIFRDIATIDQGPGYLNGVLSLWLNSSDPASEFNAEEARARPYFHDARAAELLSALDYHFPQSSDRGPLHAMLVGRLLTYGNDDAVRAAAKQFLADFPNSPDRLSIAFDLADVDARKKNTDEEFALYDSLLTELSGKLNGLPLTSAAAGASRSDVAPDEASIPGGSTAGNSSEQTTSVAALLSQSIDVSVGPPESAAIGQQYRTVLNRYLARLVITGQLQAALNLLRHELDRNPNDPLLYERLADFLQQNNFAAQEEATYQQAIARFQSATFYDKLARVYLRHRQQSDFDSLSRKVVDTFRGTELEGYFANVDRTWPQEFLQLNLYAHQRFPHDLVFTRNLLSAYQTRGTANPAACEMLLRQHWQDAPDLQVEFFGLLSRTGRLPAELRSLGAMLPNELAAEQNPAAAHELAEIDMWQSHFEAAAPLLGRLSTQYPAETGLDDEAASVFRSLAYFDPPQAVRAAAIEEHLAAFEPADMERLATIGDILADSTNPSLNISASQQLAAAAPFWRRMPEVHPGVPDGYLEAATVFWDYFQFDDALGEITAARERFHSSVLFAYQAGAIHENQGDVPNAVNEYITAATSSNETNTGAAEARARLLVLAKRPVTEALVDRATALFAETKPSLKSLELRADVLSAAGRSSDVAPLITKAIGQTTTADQLASLATFGAEHNLPEAQEEAMMRQIAITNDPTERISLQYQLVRVYTDQHDTASAQRLVDAIYAANPRIIGVVRSTVDFDWSNHQEARAISVLGEAAHAANPELARDFTLEAIDKSNRSGDYAGARLLLQPLLDRDPFNAKYLDLEAQSFSLAHDDAGVQQLYTRTIDALKVSTLSIAEKRNRIAQAREALIPALTNLRDYAGAMEQHIALLSAFPEDDATLGNAIAYARLHHCEPQFIAFLKQTAAESPRDSRFIIDLARADTAFDDNAGALAAYSKAIVIRSDRPDLYIARAVLEERAQNYDAACVDYDRLFNLTYKDPQWMEKAALARARQGRPELAVQALQAAYLDGSTPTVEAYFTVAEQLAQWNFLTQADLFAAKGVALAGPELVTKPSLNGDARFYASLLARERRANEAIDFFARLRQQAVAVSAASPEVVKQQVAEQGLAAVTDAQWRRHLLDIRRAQAESTFEDAVRSVAEVAGQLYTPEEQVSFATMLDAKRADRPAEEVVSVWIPAAKAANLKDREAEWRRDILLHGGTLAAAQLSPYDELEHSRMDFTPLAETLDGYAAQLPAVNQTQVLSMAATAWHDAGNVDRETRDVRALVLRHGDVAHEERLFDLYLNGNPEALLALVGDSNVQVSDAAANFVLQRENEGLTVKAINLVPTRPAVWRTAMRALIGLYFDDQPAATSDAFGATLGSLIIGDQLSGRPDSTQQLVGDPWFAYGTRYGLFLAIAPQPARASENFMPAELEQAPTDPGSYTALGDTYRDAHNLQAALTEYGHALEIDPAEATPEIHIAETELEAGDREAALAAYRKAFAQLRATVDMRRVPELFWADFAQVASDAHTHRLGVELQPAMDGVLRAYVHKNGDYRADELLQSAWTAVGLDEPARATAWLLTLTDIVPSDDRSSLIDSISTLPIPEAQREPILRARLASAREERKSAEPTQVDYEQQQLDASISSYVEWLLSQHRSADAAALLDSVQLDERRAGQFPRLELLLAVQQSHLEALLDAYRAQPGTAPGFDVMLGVANSLRLKHDDRDSRVLLEFVFARKRELQQLEDADFLALAQARLDTGDTAGALYLLHLFTQRDDFYDNLDAAASLLERTHHPAEALLFLQPFAQGNAWNSNAQLRLAEAQLAAQRPDANATLQSVASSRQSPYRTRVLAALALHRSGSSGHFDSEELTELASGTATSQSRFVYGRIIAAQSSASAATIAMLRAALLAAPDELSDFIRLRLFQGEARQNHFDAASVAIEPVLNRHSELRTPANDGIGEESDSDIAAPTPKASSDYFTLNEALPDEAAHREFLLTLGDVEQHRDEPAAAIEDLRVAGEMHPPAAQAQQIDGRIRSLQSAVDLAEENARRRPVIQASLVESVVVRPRLTAVREVHP